jgi:hypothetical protein
VSVADPYRRDVDKPYVTRVQMDEKLAKIGPQIVLGPQPKLLVPTFWTIRLFP